MSLPVVERAYKGSRPLTPSDVAGNIVKAGKAIEINCTVAGNVSMLMTDGSTHVVPVNVGLSRLTDEVLRVNATGTTATATYANLD
jgi:hypothetical protein